MAHQNKLRNDSGSVLVEAVVGTIFLMLFTLFTIDLSLTTVTMHTLNYLARKCARKASISAEKRVEDLKKQFRRSFILASLRELRAQRVRSLKIDMLNEKGSSLSKGSIIKSGNIITLRVEADIRMNFVPFRLFALLGLDPFFQDSFQPDGTFDYKKDVTFMVE